MKKYFHDDLHTTIIKILPIHLLLNVGAFRNLHWPAINRTYKFVMRLYLFSLLFAVSHAFAGNAQTVTLHGKNIPLSKVFEEIRKQTGYNVLGDSDILNRKASINVDVKEMPIEIFLNHVLTDQPVQFIITDGNIVLAEKPIKSPISNHIATIQDVPSQINIYGTIIDETARPMKRATVFNRTQKKSVASLPSGNFQLKANSGDILEVSFLGYQTLIVKITYNGERFNLTTTSHEVDGTSRILRPSTHDAVLQLVPSPSSLDEVQVMGYGETTKRLTTGNSTTISGEEIALQPVMNPLLAIQGRVPGVYITPTTHHSSSPVFTEIRGRNSINPLTLNEPLIVIDGVPQTTLQVQGAARYNDLISSGVSQAGFSTTGGQSVLFGINPHNIESLTILQDADATAIYGARGANGVIIINTKGGKPGRTGVGVSINNTVNVLAKQPELLSLDNYLKYRREVLENDGLAPTILNAPDLTKWDQTRSTNWTEELGGIGYGQNYNAFISGGDERTTFRISGAFNNTVDIFSKGGKNQTGNTNLNLSHWSRNRKLRIDFNTGYMTSYVNAVSGSDSHFKLPPNAPPVYDENGNPNWAEWSNGTRNNPYPFADQFRKYETNNTRFNSDANLSLELLKGLRFSGRFGLNYNINQNDTEFPKASFNPDLPLSLTTVLGLTRIMNQIMEAQLSYKTNWGALQFNTFITASSEYARTITDDDQAIGFDDDELMKSIGNAMMVFASNNFAEYRFASAFGRVQLNYDQKLIFNLNFRRDGSSRFGPGSRYGNFGSVGMAWIASEESWIKPVLPNWISFLKFRASGGLIGGDGVSDYEYLSRYSKMTKNGRYSLYGYQDKSIFLPVNPYNQIFHWETTKSLEGAVSLAFFKDKVDLEYFYYQKTTGDQLLDMPMPLYSGFNYMVTNWDAKVRNTGFGINVNVKAIENQHTRLNLSLNASANKNILLEYPDFEYSPYYTKLIVGKPTSIKYIQRFLGVDPLTGLYVYEDTNGDGVVSENRNAPLGSGYDDKSRYYDTRPYLTWNLVPTFHWKRLSVSASLNFVSQVGEDPTYNLYGSGMNNVLYSDKILNNNWKKPGDITDYPIHSTSNKTVVELMDKSYLQINNLAISYSLPENLIKKLKLTEARVNFSSNNLYVFSKYSGEPIYMWSTFAPSARTFSGGISLTL